MKAYTITGELSQNLTPHIIYPKMLLAEAKFYKKQRDGAATLEYDTVNYPPPTLTLRGGGL